MIVVTGGAGFIGSNLVAALAERGTPPMECDVLGSGEKWRNLAKHEIADIVAPDDLPARLESEPATAIVHLGANSSTTERNADRIVDQNFRYSLNLWNWCAANDARFIYASSAATYGDGAAGFADDDSVAGLAALRPLNLYGWSKHLFDRRVARRVADGAARPRQWVGLKLFNVFGPNEYHKGPMRSVVLQAFEQLRRGAAVELFKSYRSDVDHGGQRRDFIYVRDCVEVILWLLDTPQVSGIFNLGTGVDRSFGDLAAAACRALDREVEIAHVDMPEDLRDRYQYLTRAEMSRLRRAGYEGRFTPLEEGVSDYFRSYLMRNDPYR